VSFELISKKTTQEEENTSESGANRIPKISGYRFILKLLWHGPNSWMPSVSHPRMQAFWLILVPLTGVEVHSA
jgi:hypothetical protein